MIQKKCTGQALVEFVIILPIFIFMLLAVIDLGKILYFKNNLESRMDKIITDYESLQDETLFQERFLEQEKSILLETSRDEGYLIFQLKRPTDIITPGLNLIFGSPYIVSVKRVIAYES